MCPAKYARDLRHWISHSIHYIGYPTLLVTCATHVFSLTVFGVSSRGTARSELGKVALKMQEMPLQAPKNLELASGRVPSAPRKLELVVRLSPSSVNSWLCSYACPKPMGFLHQCSWVKLNMESNALH